MPAHLDNSWESLCLTMAPPIESLFRKILETSLSANIVQGTPNLGRGGGGVQRFFRNKPKISRFFRNKDIFCTKALGLHRGMHTSTERIANALKYPEYRKFSPAALECTYQSHRCTNHWEVISAVIGWFEVRWSIAVINFIWHDFHPILEDTPFDKLCG